MKKDFLDEVMEELQKLKDEQKKVTITAPVAPHKVLKAISQVAKNHEFTLEEKKTFITMAAMLDGTLSPAEMAELQKLDKHDTACTSEDEKK